MQWDASLETGIPVVDEQHRSLFRQVDDLLDSSKADRVGRIMDFLGDYVVMHFKTEEMMQKASKYPQSREHKKLHEDFIVTFGKLKAEYEECGGGMLILMKITKLALDWLQTHIRGSDKHFADYFKSTGIDPSRIAFCKPGGTLSGQE